MKRAHSNLNRSDISRRELLAVGGLSAIGLSLPYVLHAEHRRAKPARAKSAILVYLFGGPSHVDMWDMKPSAPAEIRGEFSPIATALPGTVYCEHLPQLAQLNDRYTLIRTMTHDRTVHGGAVGFVLTGTRTGDPGIPGVRGPDATPDDHPCLGATINRFAPAIAQVPTAVTLPWDMTDGQGRKPPGQTAALLGPKYDPWLIEADPNDRKFRVEGLSLQPGISIDRLRDRQGLLGEFDRQRSLVETIASAGLMNDYYRHAFSILTSAETQTAIDISREPDSLRDRYGRNTFGQSCLLARRMIEAGVRFVQVNMGNRLFGDYGWDTHSHNFPQHRDQLLPKFDPGFSTLLIDLEERGLLDETLVIGMGEFGRTPKISAGGGRDHWPQCYSLILAGAGIQHGLELGQSDSHAEYPILRPVTPEDLVATIYDLLGIDPAQPIHDRLNREHPLVRGDVIGEVLAG
ncbi:MAG: DUF1501 domain-containing protein [Planctomycetaceae bacterium]